jgi:hypothetical protein
MPYACLPHCTAPRIMGDNIKSGSFLRKPLKTLAYAIYIERRSPFIFCYFTYFSTGYEWGELGRTSGRTLFKPRPICLGIFTIIYLIHAQTVVKPDFLFSPPFIGKTDVPATANEGEDVLRICITPPDICSGVSQITHIYIRNKITAEFGRKYMLGGVGGGQQVHYP